MTSADHPLEDGVRLEPGQLWMLPLILFRMICDFFQDEKAALKRLRHRTPKTGAWQAHYWDLRVCEWRIRIVLAEGAKRLLAGETIDLSSLVVPPMPEDWLPPMPASSRAMCLRFEDVANFHADPEAFIRRHAQRLAAQADRPAAPPAAAVPAASANAASLPVPAWILGVPAPP